jgi:hypothetical protein
VSTVPVDASVMSAYCRFGYERPSLVPKPLEDIEGLQCLFWKRA